MEVWFSDSQNNNEKKKGKLNSKSKTRNVTGRRAHHNALEQKRRGVIRGCFESLRNSVPSLDSEEKKLSRSGILRETARYIKATRERVAEYQTDIEKLRLQNELLSNELEFLESMPIEDSPWYKDFDSFLNDSMRNTYQTENNSCFDATQTEVIETGEGNVFVNSVAEEQRRKFVNTAEGFTVERNLIEQRKWRDSNSPQLKREIQRKFSEEEGQEDLLIDIESFAENPFSRY